MTISYRPFALSQRLSGRIITLPGAALQSLRLKDLETAGGDDPASVKHGCADVTQLTDDRTRLYGVAVLEVEKAVLAQVAVDFDEGALLADESEGFQVGRTPKGPALEQVLRLLA